MKAHIIPLAFYRHALELRSRTPPLLISADAPHGKRAPQGVYDQDILCAACEKRFKLWDTYGAQLLLEGFREANFVPENQVDQPVVHVFENVDYTKLKLFFLSVLWRADRSTQEFFRGIDLGSHEPILRSMLLKSDPGAMSDYSVIALRFMDPDARRTFRGPTTERDPETGVNFCNVCMAGYEILIKVDARPPPAEWIESRAVLSPDSVFPVIIPAGYEHSKQQRSAMSVFRRHFDESEHFRRTRKRAGQGHADSTNGTRHRS